MGIGAFMVNGTRIKFPWSEVKLTPERQAAKEIREDKVRAKQAKSAQKLRDEKLRKLKVTAKTKGFAQYIK